jgi:hypothetical protein
MRDKRPDITREVLYQKYIIEDKTSKSISEELGCKESFIKTKLLKFGLATKSKDKNKYLNREILYQKYVIEDKEPKEIAEELNCTVGQVVHRLFKKYKITKDENHGMSRTRIYAIWCGIKNRCNNINEKNYRNYGGRGIVVCDEWEFNFLNFYNWAIDHGYQEDLEIDRIDCNGPYSPDNCRFVTHQENIFNKRGMENSSSKYKGVHWDKWNKKWCASIGYNKKRIHIGYFKSEERAAFAYNEKAKELFGDNAHLNKIDNIESIPPEIRRNKSSKYVGVSLNKRINKWVAYIRVNNKRIDMGYFNTENEAAQVYNKKALELFGDKARLNKIEEDDNE